MRSLTATQVLQVWETGRDLHLLDRALVILAAGSQPEEWSRLADFPVGERDRRLLLLYEATFSPVLESQACCPGCGQVAEFDVNISSLLENASPRGPSDFEWTAPGGATFGCRPATSRDLAAALAISDGTTARRALAGACIQRGDSAVLQTADIAALAEQMAMRDPLADIRFDLLCPACSARWEARLNIAAYFWNEIKAESRRLVTQVNVLARAYGWREADILAMSGARRQMYLDLIG